MEAILKKYRRDFAGAFLVGCIVSVFHGSMATGIEAFIAYGVVVAIFNLAKF